MQVVSQDDINMYARGLIGRQGRRALAYAKDQSRRLADLKDEEGAIVWQRVADAVAGRIEGTARG
jgi:hypothetical protein